MSLRGDGRSRELLICRAGGASQAYRNVDDDDAVVPQHHRRRRRRHRRRRRGSRGAVVVAVDILVVDAAVVFAIAVAAATAFYAKAGSAASHLRDSAMRDAIHRRKYENPIMRQPELLLFVAPLSEQPSSVTLASLTSAPLLLRYEHATPPPTRTDLYYVFVLHLSRYPRTLYQPSCHTRDRGATLSFDNSPPN